MCCTRCHRCSLIPTGTHPSPHPSFFSPFSSIGDQLWANFIHQQWGSGVVGHLCAKGMRKKRWSGGGMSECCERQLSIVQIISHISTVDLPGWFNYWGSIVPDGLLFTFVNMKNLAKTQHEAAALIYYITEIPGRHSRLYGSEAYLWVHAPANMWRHLYLLTLHSMYSPMCSLFVLNLSRPLCKGYSFRGMSLKSVRQQRKGYADDFICATRLTACIMEWMGVCFLR